MPLHGRDGDGPSGLAERVPVASVEATDLWDLIGGVIPEGVLLVGADSGRIVEANAAALAMYGYTHSELLFQSIRDVRAPETLCTQDAQISQALTEGVLVETVHVRKDGKRFPVEISTREIILHGKRTLVQVIRDITRRKAQLEVIDHRTRLCAVQGQINLAVGQAKGRASLLDEICRIVVEVGLFRIAWVGHLNPVTRCIEPSARHGDDQGYLDRIRVSADDVALGRGVTGAAFREGHTSTCHDFLTSPQMTPWHGEGARIGLSCVSAFPLHDSTGVTAVLTVYATAVGVIGEDEIGLLEQVARAASFGLHHLEAEAARAAAEAETRQWADAFQHCTHGIVMHSPETGRIIACNPAFLRMCGEPKAPVGEPVLALYAPEERARLPALLRQADRAGQVEYETRMLRADGSEFPVQEGIVTVLDGRGVPLYRVSTAVDLTERNQAADARDQLEKQFLDAQKMEALGILAAGIAHDFNNILTPILAHTELALLDAPPNTPMEEDLSQILKAADRAKVLVRQILTLSRRVEDVLAPVELGPLVHEVSKLLRASLPPTIAIRTEIDPGCGPVVAELTRLHQVLMNLCTNARDAMAEKGGVLTLTLARTTRGRLRLSVSDTGTGIPHSLLVRIFDPFFTTKEIGKGTGLGLATVRTIVGAMDGEILIHSVPGQGTTFDVLLHEAEHGLPPIATNTDFARGDERLVMVVDDEPSIAHSLPLLLLALGYRATAFTDSAEALAAFAANPGAYSVLITDYNMPGMSGVELAAQVRKIQPQLPVILATGLAEGLREGVMAEEGPGVLILKPFMLREIGKAMETVLAVVV